jgi:hypothetical protein
MTEDKDVGKVTEHWSKELGGADIEIPKHFDSTEDMIDWLRAVINYLKEIEETEDHPVIISETSVKDRKIQLTFGESGLCQESSRDEEEILKVKR